MNIIVCVDDEFGMLFNHRRQSRDQQVIEKIKKIAGNKLWITEFSSVLFENCANISSDMLEKAE